MNSIGTNTIITERLILRRFIYEDADDMLKIWVSKPEIQYMYSEPVYTTKDEVNELLNKYISAYSQNDTYRWAIIERKSNKCIGQIAFFLVDTKNHFAEIEYCIGPDYQKKGYMTEALKEIIKYGFDKIKLHKIQISTKENNMPSKRVIEKCGFTYEGTLRDYFYFEDKYIDRLYFSMLKREYHNNLEEISKWIFRICLLIESEEKNLR